MSGLHCGIDIGSTNLKVVLVAEDGDVVHSRSVPTPRTSDAFGPVTDPSALVSHLEEMIIEGWEAVGRGEPLASIASAGVGEDGVIVAEDMTAIGPAIPWFDRRAEDEAAFLENRYGQLIARTGIAFGTDRTAAKWLWMHRNLTAKVRGTARWIALTDYPAAFWTGRSFMSASLAPRTACFDVRRRRWINDLLEATHAPPVPNLLDGGVGVGTVTRGRLRTSDAVCDQTVVAAGGHDHPVAASVIKAFDPNGMVDSLGTANLLYGECAEVRQDSVDRRLALSLPPDGRSGIAYLGVIELNAAMEAAGIDDARLRACLSQASLPGEPPRTASELNADQADMDLRIRRILELESLRARSLMQEMENLGVPSGAIYATGGWSRSPALMELRASIFGQAVNVIGDMEMSALGAARLGAKAANRPLACNLGTDNIKCTYPKLNWARAYGDVFDDIERGQP